MTLPHGVNQFPVSARKAALRARAAWAFVIAVIGLSAAVVGLVQYVASGAVSIRPGRDALVGVPAIEALIALSLVSTGFLICGLIIRSKARRNSAS